MADEEDSVPALEPSARAFLKKMLQDIGEERAESRAVVRLDAREMAALTRVLHGNGDGVPSALARVTSLEENSKKVTIVVFGPHDKQQDGLVSKVASNGKTIGTWVRIQWMLGGSVGALILKALFDALSSSGG